MLQLDIILWQSALLEFTMNAAVSSLSTEEIYKVISLSMDGASFVMLICLLAYTILRYNARSRTDRYFATGCLLIIGMLIGDVVTLFCEGTEKSWYPLALNLGALLLYACGILLPLVFTEYLTTYIGIEEKKKKMYRFGIMILAIVAELIVFLNLFLGFFYHIDPVTQTYQRGPLWLTSQLIAIPMLIFDVYLLARYGRNMLKAGIAAVVAFGAVPLIGCMIQWRFYGISASYVTMSLSIFIIYYSVKVEQDYQIEKQQKELAESRTAIMLSQIQPHFMYNALTTIASLCESNPQEAKKTTLSFSRYLRQNLESVNKRIPVPVSSELEHVRTYLSLEKHRYGDKLQVEYYIADTDFVIPALTIQPIVENAVKHGLKPKEEGGTIKITMYDDDRYHEICVEDDGVGYDVNKPFSRDREHIGIANVKDRLMSISNAQMAIYSTPGRGTTVTISIPKVSTLGE